MPQITLPFDLATVVSAPFDENTYILHHRDRDDCLVVDPGFDPESVLAMLRENDWTPAAILNTHGHADHIAGNGALKRAFPQTPLLIGVRDAPKLTDAALNLSGGYGIPITSPPADRLLQPDERLDLAGFSLLVREIPGHSIGHVVFVLEGVTPGVVLAGDTLFQGSIGRTDFPDGSFENLRAGIHQHLFTLPNDTLVLSGHGPPTTIGRERRTNPFVGEE